MAPQSQPQKKQQEAAITADTRIKEFRIPRNVVKHPQILIKEALNQTQTVVNEDTGGEGG